MYIIYPKLIKYPYKFIYEYIHIIIIYKFEYIFTSVNDRSR